MYYGKHARKDWVNEYGYNEGYTYKDISMSLSGHLCRGSVMETDNSCGNCDGGRCDSCREVYTVSMYDPPHEVITDYGWSELHDTLVSQKRFFDRSEAEAYYDSL